MADAQLYEDTFTVEGMNMGNYDRVGRVTAPSSDGTTVLTLDINTDLYPLMSGDSFSLLLASTLNLDGSKGSEDDDISWREHSGPSLADHWDYVCYGKIYRFDETNDGDGIKVYVSFGGLLLYIEGPYKKLTTLRIDNVYLLLRK